jgi:hypothetical protein
VLPADAKKLRVSARTSLANPFRARDIRETPDLHAFKKGACFGHQSRWGETMFVEDFRRHYDEERALGNALIARASERSSVIRQRLAAVAIELRQAAAAAGSESEGLLLKIASQFEQQSKPGDRT